MLLKKKANSSCCTTPDCCAAPAQEGRTPDCCAAPKPQPGQAPDASVTPTGIVCIDFLFLDLAVCSRCQGTSVSLDEAVAAVSHVLGLAGYQVEVSRLHVDSEELALRHRFVSSPTIRVNGRDIAMEVKESLCESCGDLCGDTVDCRVWTWQGREYAEPPTAMVIDGILRAVYNPACMPAGAAADAGAADGSGQPFELPENLKRFYASMRRKGK